MDYNSILAKYAHFYGQVDTILVMECRNEIRPETALNRLREIVKEFEREQPERHTMTEAFTHGGLPEAGE